MASVRTIREVIKFEGRDYVLTFDWDVLSDFEETYRLSVADVLEPPGGGSPMMSRLVKLFRHGLLPEHPEVDLNEAGAMMMTAAIADIFMGAINGAMPQPGDNGEDGETPGANPPNRAARRAAKSRAGGKTGSSRQPKQE